MATTTATITLNSPDITGDPLSLTKTSTLTKAGTATGLDQFTGIIVAASAYADTTTSHKVYIKNSAEGASDFVTVELGGSNVFMGRLYPGDWCFFPYDGTLDVDIDTSAAGMKVEFGVFSQSAAS